MALINNLGIVYHQYCSSSDRYLFSGFYATAGTILSTGYLDTLLLCLELITIV
jgi:hypothetical protein